MQVALIAPKSLLSYQYRTSMQLLLPQLLDSTTYNDYYHAFRNRGDHIIMDNGAAEGVPVSDNYLITMAFKHEVDEVAVPDILGDAERTYYRALDFFGRIAPYIKNDHFHFGYVVTGTNIEEAYTWASKFLQGPYGNLIDVLYLPRLLVTEKDHHARIKLAQRLRSSYYGKYAIHMFGSSPHFPREVMAIRSEAPFVRSIDTSLPFVLTTNNASIMANRSTPDKAIRPINYFSRGDGEFDRELLERNVGTYLAWAEQ